LPRNGIGVQNARSGMAEGYTPPYFVVFEGK